MNKIADYLKDCCWQRNGDHGDYFKQNAFIVLYHTGFDIGFHIIRSKEELESAIRLLTDLKEKIL